MGCGMNFYANDAMERDVLLGVGCHVRPVAKGSLALDGCA